MEYSYLYEFNKERYYKMEERQFPCKEVLGQKVVENGYLLPNRFAPNRLFGHGGVVDENQNYIKESEMNAYAKYAATPCSDDDMEIYMGEGYPIDDNVTYINEEVVYLGYLNNHWGHFLVDCSSRLYSFLSDKEHKYKYVYLVNEGEEYKPIASIRRFFELLGIAEHLIFVNQVTKCKKIIIPEPGYIINGYYSKKYLDVFRTVAEKVDCSKYDNYEKVYYSRANIKKAQNSEIGEEILLNIFKKSGFTIVSPEKYTLDEQIAIIRNTKLLAGIAGTLPHNLLFAKPGQKMVVINKTHNLNIAQMDINQMCQINMTYVDAYLAKFPVLIGVGPFFLTYSSKLQSFIKKEGLCEPDKELITEIVLAQNSKIYEKRYRLRYIGQRKTDYQKDKRMFDYFAPEHLIQYLEETYYLNEPIKVSEKLSVFMERVLRKIKK